jgi:hypothetical protein
MGNISVSQAKNIIRRALLAKIDRPPTSSERRKAWQFFDFACAYCARSVDNTSGGLDHLVPTSAGGLDHIANRVVACNLCNSHEKRDSEWQTFLRTKAGTDDIFEMRRAKILAWSASVALPQQDETLRALAERHVADALAGFDKALASILLAKRGAA